MKSHIGLTSKLCKPAAELVPLEEKELNLLKGQIPGWKVTHFLLLSQGTYFCALCVENDHISSTVCLDTVISVTASLPFYVQKAHVHHN